MMLFLITSATIPADAAGTGVYQLSCHHLGIHSNQYAYMNDLRALSRTEDIHQPSSVTHQPSPSPIQIPVLAMSLRYHPDQDFSSFILRGLLEGFHIGYTSQTRPLRTATRNHPSSLANPQAVSAYIRSEATAGRMVGPLINTEGVHCSPIGLVPKGRGTGAWRMIVDLSYPNGMSVNDGIAPSLCSLTYSSVDDAIQFITKLGRGALLVKIDIKNAYRIIPVHPHDHHLLGVQWEGHVYIDRALPFGLRSAPKLFTAFADAIGWSLLHWGSPPLIHYLDDFLFFLSPEATESMMALPRIVSILDQLGVPIATQKVEGPATVVTFLGIIVDTDRRELRLPVHKLEYIGHLVSQWRGRRSGRVAEFESLLGHLSHAATVIRQGRIFLRHLFVLLSSTRSRHHHIHLDAIAKADLLWWEYFLQQWNGTMFFPQPPTPAAHVYTDASGTFGCGGVVWASHWFYLQWPTSWSTVDIAVKELVPVVIAAALWGRSWHRMHIRFHCDNMAVVDILRKRSARSPLAHHLLRCLYFYTALFQFDYTAEHIPGVLNTAADALSRNNLPLFSSLLPQAVQVQVPAPLQDMLLILRPDWGSPLWIRSFLSTLPMPSPLIR